MHSEIIDAFNKEESVIAIFIDIKGAYNFVQPKILIKKLHKLGIPKHMFHYSYNLLSLRQLHFRYGEIDEVLWTDRGVPQGGVCSPIFYDIIF